MMDGIAAETRRAYQRWTAAWAQWLARNGREVTPDAVAGFMAELAASGYATSSIRQASAAVAWSCSILDDANPCTAPIVKRTIRAIAREQALQGRTQRQARPLTCELVAIIRGALRVRPALPAVNLRDIAVISLGTACGLRRGELAALQWRDYSPMFEGDGRICVRRSKADQEGRSAILAIPLDVSDDLLNWRAAAANDKAPDAPIFGVTDRTIGNIVQRAVEWAKLGNGYSAHSLRTGMAVSMTAKGAPHAVTMRQGRWQSSTMLARYTAGQEAAQALAYL